MKTYFAPLAAASLASLALFTFLACGSDDNATGDDSTPGADGGGSSPDATVPSSDGGSPSDTGTSDGASTRPDAGPRHWSRVDISAGGAANSGHTPSLVIDTVNGKLLIASDDGSNGDRPALVRCNLDGTSCTHIDISAGAAANSGFSPSAAIDSVNGKLLVAATGDVAHMNLFRCNLDGTSCTRSDISADAGSSSGTVPSLRIDSTLGKLFVATNGGLSAGGPTLLRCNVDGSSCAWSSMGVGLGASPTSAESPSLAVDNATGRVLVVTEDDGRGFTPSYFSCDANGAACTYKDLSADAGTQSGHTPSAAFDSVNGKLVVATESYVTIDEHAALIRCNADGTSCVFTNIDIDAGSTNVVGLTPSLGLDPAGDALHIAAVNSAGGLSAFQCKLDGTACSYADVTGDAGMNSGHAPSLAIDPATGNVYVATEDQANGSRLELFMFR